MKTIRFSERKSAHYKLAQKLILRRIKLPLWHFQSSSGHLTMCNQHFTETYKILSKIVLKRTELTILKVTY